MPAAAKGKKGDYCSNDNQCSSALCDGLAPNSSGGWTPGKCGTKRGLGGDCTSHGQCGSGSCHAGLGCVPAGGKGRRGDFCTHDNQCASSHCGGLLTAHEGTCEVAVTDPASHLDKTRVFIQNDTNQWLLLEDYDVSSSLQWDTGRHFYAKKTDEVARYPMQNGYPLRRQGYKAVPPGERVQVAWMQRGGLANGKEYSFRLKVAVDPSKPAEKVVIKAKLRGQVVGSAIWFGLDDSNWYADTVWHRVGWRLTGTKVAGRRWDGSGVKRYEQTRDQRISIRYRALTRPGIGGDIEYVFVGPTPPVRFTAPVEPASHLLDGRDFVGPFHMDHNMWPRTNAAACSDFAGRGNDLTGLHCYGKHEGNDFGLAGAFETMKTKSTWVVAAAPGTVLRVVDGHFDKCGLNFGRIDDIADLVRMLENPTCPASAANLVEIDHGHGIVTRYLHLKRGTIKVAPGDTVTCGQRLAQVGSSGRSTMPHLHFDVIDNEAHVDPFRGVMSTRSFWRKQGSGRIPEAACH